MIVYVCLSDLEGVPFTEEQRNDSHYLSYLFMKLTKPIGEYKYLAYPLYSSKDNIPEMHKNNGYIRKIKVINFDIYSSIRKRERAEKAIKNVFDELLLNAMLKGV